MNYILTIQQYLNSQLDGYQNQTGKVFYSSVLPVGYKLFKATICTDQMQHVMHFRFSQEELQLEVYEDHWYDATNELGQLRFWQSLFFAAHAEISRQHRRTTKHNSLSHF